MSRPSVMHFINGFESGGAEHGIVHLVDQGFYDTVTLQVVALVAGDGRVRDALSARGVSTEVLFPYAGMSLATMLRGLLRLARRLRARRPDVLILSLPQANLVGRLAAIAAPGTRVCAFEHNTRYSKAIYGPLLRATSVRVDCLLADTEQTLAEVYRRYYLHFRERKSYVVPLVAFAEPRSRQKYDYRLGAPVRIVSVGRLTRTKNHSAVIGALQVLRTKGIEARLTIYGEGPLGDSLRLMADSLELSDRVVLAGFDRNWTAQACAADLFVIPSLHEGLCIVALEAMHCGLPVIAARTGGLLDYGEHGKNLWFLEASDSISVAEAVAALVADQPLRARLGLAGHETARLRLSEPNVRQRLASIAADLFATGAGLEGELV